MPPAALIARRTARAEHSAALYANSWHFATDFAGSLAVLAGLVLAAFGYPKGDAIAALVVAAIVMVVAITLAVRNVESLMDFAPRGLDQRISEAALSVPGVEEVRSVAGARERGRGIRGRGDRRAAPARHRAEPRDDGRRRARRRAGGRADQRAHLR